MRNPYRVTLALAAAAMLLQACAEVPVTDAQPEYRGEYVTGSHLRRNDLGSARVLGRDELERADAMRPGVLDPPPGIPPQAPRL